MLHELQRDLKELEVHVDFKGHSLYLVFFFGWGFSKKDWGDESIVFFSGLVGSYILRLN